VNLSGRLMKNISVGAMETNETKEKKEKVPRQKIPEQDPQKRVRNFEEVPFGYSEETAIIEAKRCIQCKKPACIGGCPVDVKIPEFIKDIADGLFVEAALKLKETNNRIVAVDLSRNFGHHYAIMAGLAYSTGDYVFLIDCDLEVPPTHIPAFYNRLKEEKECDVVYGIQEKRKGSFIERTIGGLFYNFFNSLTY